MAGLLLGKGGESAADGCAHTHQLLQAPDGQTIHSVEGEAIACGSILELLGSDFACLQQTQDLSGGFLDSWVKSGNPVLDIKVVPAVRDVIL